MPVRFQGSSEYARNYQWHEFYKNRNNSSTGQIGHIAGLTSDKFGLVTEPPLQHRRIFENQDPRERWPDRDEYILLGDQSKFANSVKYPLKHFRSFYDRQGDAETDVNSNNRHVSPPRRSPPPAPRPADPPKKHTVKGASYQAGHQARPKKPNQTVQSRPEKPSAKPSKKPGAQTMPSPKPSGGKPAQRVTVNSKQPEKVDHFVQTDLDALTDPVQQPPVDADYAMKYRAKIAPPRPVAPIRRSEYQTQFKWHENMNSSPLIAAEQVVYKSHPVLAGAKDIGPKESVYKQEFKAWKYVPVEKRDSAAKKQKMERSKSLESLVPAGTDKKIPPDNRRLLKESQNPLRPFFPHGKSTDYQTEYQKNFHAFSDYEYDHGAWRSVRPTHAESKKPAESEKAAQRPVSASAQTDRSWYEEVRELRKRAAEYRQRARGTHFSREHLAQLYARQADLWDTVSNSSTLSALSLENAKRARANEKSKSSPDRPPAGIRTAWDNVPALPLNDARPGARETGSARSHSNSSNSPVSSLSPSSSPRSEPQPAHPQPSESNSSSEGRIPTPKIRVKPTKGILLRHHLDRTTPAVGGALLTSPPKKKQDSEAGSSPRQVPSETRSEPIPAAAPVRPAQVRCTCGAEGKTRPSVQSQTSPMFSSVKTPPTSPAKASTSSMFQPITRKPVSTSYQEPVTLDVQERQPAGEKPQDSPASRSAGMLYGLPTRDTHLLVDETASEDRPLSTHYTRSPPQSKNSVARRLEYKAKHPELSIPTTIMEGGTTDYLNGAAADDDDILSLSARSVASSSSLASEVLERARNRRDEFWGNPAATRK